MRQRSGGLCEPTRLPRPVCRMVRCCSIVASCAAYACLAKEDNVERIVARVVQILQSPQRLTAQLAQRAQPAQYTAVPCRAVRGTMPRGMPCRAEQLAHGAKVCTGGWGRAQYEMLARMLSVPERSNSTTSLRCIISAHAICDERGGDAMRSQTAQTQHPTSPLAAPWRSEPSCGVRGGLGGRGGRVRP